MAKNLNILPSKSERSDETNFSHFSHLAKKAANETIQWGVDLADLRTTK